MCPASKRAIVTTRYSTAIRNPITTENRRYQPGRNSTARATTIVTNAIHPSVSASPTGSRYEAVSIVLSELAWIMTPGNPPDLSTGTSWLSPSVGSTAPTNTILPRSFDGLTLPSSTSTAEMTDASVVASRPSAQLRRRLWRPSVGMNRPPACSPSGRRITGPDSPCDTCNAATDKPGTIAPL